MDPFDVTVHQVNGLDDNLDDDDSFCNVVNYDTSFNQSGVSLPLSAYNVNAAQFTWKDVTTPTTSGIQTTSGGIPTGQTGSVQHQSVWHDASGSSPPHLSFLVHPDGQLSKPETKNQSLSSPASEASNREQLRILAQISSNTTAISRQSKRIGQFVARTVTSPSTAIPPPHFTSMSANEAMMNSHGDAAENGNAGDNSFETVAEALRLQWSVIGNKSLAPAPPEVVAQIVAEAERKMKTGDSSPLQQGFTPVASPTPYTPNLQDLKHPMSPPNVMVLSETPVLPRELTRVIPTEITVEKPSYSKATVAMAGGSKATAANATSTVNAHQENSKPPLNANSKTTLLSLAHSIPAPAVPNVGNEVESGGTAQKDMPPGSNPPPFDILDTISEASYSSELELEKYSQVAFSTVGGIDTDYELESETFLRSLPPIKPINLDNYASPSILPPFDPSIQGRLKKSSTPRVVNPKSHPSTGYERDGSLTTALNVSPSRSNRSAIVSPIIAGQVSPAVPSTKAESSPFVNLSSPTNRSAYYSPNESSPYFSALSDLSTTRTPNTPTNSSMVSKKQLDDALKAKAKLQGQLEILTSESQNVLKERADLQSLLATLQAKLASSDGDSGAGVDGKELRKEVDNLRTSRRLLEQTVLDANRLLSEKAEELRTLGEELQSANDHVNKFQVRVDELKDDIRAKDMNAQALKNKIAELYVEVQTSIQAKMEAENESRTSGNDLASLVKSKEWYQQQLQQAHEVRSKLQRELTMLQGQSVSHGTIVERLKTESARLRQQLSEVQQRALRDKEALARHLESIQGDMMEREAAFLEIQRERKLYEDTFNSQVVTAEEGKSRLESLQQATHELESQLDRAHGEAKKRHDAFVTMENSHIETMKKLTLAGENLGGKEHDVEEMSQKLIQMESQLHAAMSDLTKKDGEILALREEKASTEIALKSALQEKSSVDKALDGVKLDMRKVEQSFKQMKQDLGSRTAELEKVKVEREKLQEELDRSQLDLEIKNRSVESMTRDFSGKNAAQMELETERNELKTEVEELKLKVHMLKSSVTEKDKLVAVESEKMDALHATVSDLQARVSEEQQSVPAEKVQMYEDEIKALHKRVNGLEEVAAHNATLVGREKEAAKLATDHFKQELLDRQKQYDENLSALDIRLRELSADKQQIETELNLTKKSQELSQMEERDSFHDEIQMLTRQLTSERQEKGEVEKQLMALQASKAAEVEALQYRLQYQNEALLALEAQQAQLADTETTNQNLELELEKERGRVIGLSQKTSELKDHAHQLEAALGQRESTLEELRLLVNESNQGQEERDAKFKTRIEGLEDAVKKEVEVQRDLRKQMGTKIVENKRLKKQHDSTKLENEQLRQDLAASQKMATDVTGQLESATQTSQKLQSDAVQNASRSRSLEVELDRVKRDLDDNLARYPVLQEQIQSLEWQCVQKSREVAVAQEQIKMADIRAQEEVDAVRASLQEKQTEIDSLQGELNALRQDKTQQRTQVSELRGALKASVQHHKLTKQLNDTGPSDKSTQADIERKVVIPPLPFDLGTIEKLLQDTRVKPLESKPLDQLSSCLTSLRAEISGLQKQMDVHTTTVHTSSHSWRNVQSEVNELNEVMRTIADTIIAANTTKTVTMAMASDHHLEHPGIMDV